MSATRRQWLIAAVIALVLCGIGLGIYHAMSGKSGKERKPPKISLIPSTPPPPPPPPKEDKKPEPPKEQKEVRAEPTPQPKEAPPAPPSQDLKMEGAAGDGPSAFSAGHVTSDDLSRIGAGGGGTPAATGGINHFANYATLIKGEVQRFLNRRKELRERPYRIEVRFWVAADGHVERHELVGSTGDADTDEALRQALGTVPRFTQVPPNQMPQPIRLRLMSGAR